MKTIITIFSCIFVLVLSGCDKTKTTVTSESSPTSGYAVAPYKPKAEDYIVKIERLKERGTSEQEACLGIEDNATRAVKSGAWGPLRAFKGAGKCSCTKQDTVYTCERDAYIGAVTTSSDGVPRNDDGTPIKGIVE